MKKIQYFKRAATDAAFRKAQIEEKRDANSSCKVLFWFLVAPGIVFLLYFAFTTKEEAARLQVLLAAVLSAWIYDSHKTTLAALEAMDESNPSPTSEEINASPQR